MFGFLQLFFASMALGILIAGARLIAAAQTSGTPDSNSSLTTLFAVAAAAGMGWFAAFKRADLMRFIQGLLARLNAIVPARLRDLLKLPQSSSDDPEDAKTKVVHRGPFGVIISISSPLCGTRWEIPAQGLAIGRDAHCDIVVDDSRVSAQHAHIRPTDRGVVVVDAASKNGVFLNDAKHRVEGEALLKPGDIVMLSATDAAHFVFCAR